MTDKTHAIKLIRLAMTEQQKLNDLVKEIDDLFERMLGEGLPSCDQAISSTALVYANPSDFSEDELDQLIEYIQQADTDLEDEEDDEDQEEADSCRHCGEPVVDLDGFDGMCGTCADITDGECASCERSLRDLDPEEIIDNGDCRYCSTECSLRIVSDE